MILPPVLYWSPSLAARHEDGPDGVCAGVIDATGQVFYTHDGHRMRAFGELPPDAARLVCSYDPPAPDTEEADRG